MSWNIFLCKWRKPYEIRGDIHLCAAWNSCSLRFCAWIWVAGQRLKLIFLYSMKQGWNRRSPMKYEVILIFCNAWKHIVLTSILIAASRSKWKFNLFRCRTLTVRGNRWSSIRFGVRLIFHHLAEIIVLSQHALWQLNNSHVCTHRIKWFKSCVAGIILPIWKLTRDSFLSSGSRHVASAAIAGPLAWTIMHSLMNHQDQWIMLNLYWNSSGFPGELSLLSYPFPYIESESGRSI